MTLSQLSLRKRVGYTQIPKYKAGDRVRRGVTSMGTSQQCGRIKTGTVINYVPGKTNKRGAKIHTYTVQWDGSKALHEVQQQVLRPIDQLS